MDLPADVPANVRAGIEKTDAACSDEPDARILTLSLDDISLLLEQPANDDPNPETAKSGQHTEGVSMDFPPYTPSSVRKYVEEFDAAVSDVPDARTLWQDEIDLLWRLATDRRMESVFEGLSDDEQAGAWVSAAWRAHRDYTVCRDRVKRAKARQEAIADAAKKLAKEIRLYAGIGVVGPGEFYSVERLLRQTSTPGPNERLWRSQRERISNPDLRYVWDTAPDLPTMLDTLAAVARGYRPFDSVMVDKATAGRNHSDRTAFIRAFAALLTEDSKITLSSTTLTAMADTATVALNKRRVTVSYDDVRIALSTKK